MNKEAGISNYQFSILLMGFIMGSTMIIVPGSHALQDAWIAYILAWAGGMVLFSLYYLLYSLNPNHTLIEMNRNLLGKWLGGLISILYIWYFIHLAALILRNFGEYVLTISLPETPLWFIVLCYILVTGYSVRSGLAVTCRTAELVVPAIFIFQLIIFFILMPHFDWTNFKPFMQGGLSTIGNATFSVIAFPFGETVVFLMLFPYVKQQKKLKNTYLLSLLLSGSLLFLGIIRDIAVIGPGGIERSIFPPHLSIQYIPYLNIDTLIGVIFFASGGAKICICFLGATIGISQLSKTKDHRPFVIPVAVILVGLTIWLYQSAPEMLHWALNIWPIYSVPFQMIIPAALLIVSFFKRALGKNRSPSI